VRDLCVCAVFGALLWKTAAEAGGATSAGGQGGTVRPIRIALYGDINLNIIDGSAIWLASLAQVLHRIDRTEVTVLRKSPPRRDVVTAELDDLPRVSLVSPRKARANLTPQAALDEIEHLNAARRFDIVLLRGYALCKLAARRPRLAGRLWVYLTDIPQDPSELTDEDRGELRTIAVASDRLLCQTEELRSYLEGVTPEVADKTILLPPMVPPMFVRVPGGRARPVRRLFYAGKFAPRWGFLETVAAFRDLRRDHPELELHVAGDKIHNPPDDPGYRPAVEAALERTEGLVWHGGVTRAQVAGLLDNADIALSARHRDLDDSLELSTKVLEYGAAGVPVVLNRVPMHSELLGEDYPLFVDDLDGLGGVIADVLAEPDRWTRARDQVRRVAADFTYDRIAQRLVPHMERHVPARAPAGGRAPRVLVASHSLKFFAAISNHLRRCGADVRFDVWEGHAKHDEAVSKKLLDWAEVIVCEWAVGNAVWYARNRHDRQRLIVRLHRMEFETEFPGEIAIDAVDRVVLVSEFFRGKAIAELGWPAGKLQVVPNWVDTLMLDRPKLPEAPFHLGLLGWIPIRKRLDRAIDVLERLSADDDSWRLYLGGKLPWELRWVWQRLAEQQYFNEQFDRIRSSPRLRRAVSFDGHQSNVPSWLRKIGYVLSPSDDESFHLAPAEGMASGAVPVVWPWDTASEVYDERWIHADADAAAEAIAATDWERERRVAQQFVRERYPLEPVTAAWADLVLGDDDP
jgi:glycosyltransferase involved in cell wall biosynthesis